MPIFSHLCRIVAVLGLIFSALMFLDAYNSSRIVDQAAALREYYSSFRLGAQSLLASIGLGTLAEISFALRRDK